LPKSKHDKHEDEEELITSSIRIEIFVCIFLKIESEFLYTDDWQTRWLGELFKTQRKLCGTQCLTSLNTVQEIWMLSMAHITWACYC